MERVGRLIERPLRRFLATGLGLVLLAGCGEAEPKRTPPPPPAPAARPLVQTPAFSGDSAYAHVAKQVAFGPRVPNTEGHRACADWLAATLEGYGADVTLSLIHI